MGDRESLRRYAGYRDQEAFGALVGRYVDLVYSSALRQVQDPHLAEDVTQGVFVLLSQRSGELASSGSPEGVLGAWLLKTTRYVAMNAIKYQARRRLHERKAAEMNARGTSAGVGEDQESIWAQLAPMLDEALAHLKMLDRSAIVLRFMEGKSHEQVGAALGLSEEAARKRTSRAIEQLRRYFAARGVTVTSAALVAGLGAYGIQQAPEALAGTVGAAVESGVAPGIAGHGITAGGTAISAAIAAGLVLLVLAIALWLGSAKGLPTALAGAPAAGARPAPAADTANGRYMDFRVVDAVNGQGIPDVGLTIRIAAEMKPESMRTLSAVTDARGVCRIPLPEKNPAVLQVEARKAALVPMGITWSAQELQGGMLASYTLKMEKGTVIGGIIRDEQGQPIAGASVMLLVEGSGQGSDYPRALIRNYEVKTDGQGRWRCDVMPSKLEGVSVKLSHPAFQSDASYGASGQPNNDDLRKMTSVLVMKKGADGAGIAGIVSDGQTGKPIAGVKVRQGDDRWGTSHPETTTGAGGEFRFASVKAGKLTLTAQAAGYMPELQQIEAKPGMAPVKLQLRKGHGFAGVVVDVAGKPVSGATVSADTWRGKRTIAWQGTTDADGGFFWDDAPADEVQYSVLKQGYMYIRDVKGTSSDEPTKFTLLPEMKIHGKVVDAETGKPIGKFRVVVGMLWKGEKRWFWNDPGSRTLTDGWYEATMFQPAEEYALRIEADGYLSVVTESIKGGTADTVRDVKLRRGSGPKGVVLGVGGKPVEGAKLFLIEEGQQSNVVTGRTTDWMMERIRNRTTSHQDGRFALQPPQKAAVLIALDEQGIAVVPLDANSPSEMTVKLNAWATIEGTLREGKKVLPRTKVYATVPDRADERVGIRTETVTDGPGKFPLKYVPPMKVEAGKLSDGQFSYYIPMANVEPKPGEAVHLDLGGTGVTITGRLEMPAGVEGSASVGAGPPMRHAEFPEDWDLMSADQRNAWTAANGGRFSLGDFHQARIGADATFELVDMPDGNFELRASVKDAKGRIAAGSETVPVSVKNSSGDTLDLGLIKLKAWPLVDIGLPCPDLSAKAMDGTEVRLGDLKGKWVLVTGWRTWIVTGAPNQRRPEDVVNAALAAGGGKLEAVTIFADERKVWVDRYLAKHPVSGRLVHAAPGKENWSDEVNAYDRAQGVLIDPDGTVRAVGLLAQGKDPAREISAAMRR